MFLRSTLSPNDETVGTGWARRFDEAMSQRVRRSFDDVSKNIVGDLVDRVFGGAREQLLMRLFDQGKLTDNERQVLEQILGEQEKR